MNAPAHNIKIFGPTIETGKINLVVIKHHWWLGSGIRDKNGVEIFEDDLVKMLLTFDFDGIVFFRDKIYRVYFSRASFFVWHNDAEILLADFDEDYLEVVGHIAEDKS